jgi:hypothetical protein
MEPDGNHVQCPARPEGANIGLGDADMGGCDAYASDDDNGDAVDETAAAWSTPPPPPKKQRTSTDQTTGCPGTDGQARLAEKCTPTSVTKAVTSSPILLSDPCKYAIDVS